MNKITEQEMTELTQLREQYSKIIFEIVYTFIITLVPTWSEEFELNNPIIENNEDKENQTGWTPKVAEEVESLNSVISSEQIVKDINSSLNNQPGFTSIFDNIKFRIIYFRNNWDLIY
jgi:hypothetical protein